MQRFKTVLTLYILGFLRFPLDKEQIAKIAELMLCELTDRIESAGVFIDLDQSIIPFLSERARADQFGARQLRREITRLIESPYADAIVSGQIKAGDLVFCKLDGDNIKFEKRKEKIN